MYPCISHVAPSDTPFRAIPAACCTPASEVQCLILTELYPDQVLAIRELAERLASDAPWVSRAVEELRRLGWVRRDPSPHDRRFVAVTLTEAGREQACRLQDELNRQSQALEGFPPEDQETVLRSLTWFANRLNDERLWIALSAPGDATHLTYAPSTIAPERRDLNAHLTNYPPSAIASQHDHLCGRGDPVSVAMGWI